MSVTSNKHDIYKQITVCGPDKKCIQVKALVDTGASWTILPCWLVGKLKLPVAKRTAVRGAGNSVIYGHLYWAGVSTGSGCQAVGLIFSADSGACDFSNKTAILGLDFMRTTQMTLAMGPKQESLTCQKSLKKGYTKSDKRTTWHRVSDMSYARTVLQEAIRHNAARTAKKSASKPARKTTAKKRRTR